MEEYREKGFEILGTYSKIPKNINILEKRIYNLNLINLNLKKKSYHNTRLILNKQKKLKRRQEE